MIKEDYVSFETAKLLKEKEFDGIVMKKYIVPQTTVVELKLENFVASSVVVEETKSYYGTPHLCYHDCKIYHMCLDRKYGKFCLDKCKRDL